MDEDRLRELHQRREAERGRRQRGARWRLAIPAAAVLLVVAAGVAFGLAARDAGDLADDRPTTRQAAAVDAAAATTTQPAAHSTAPAAEVPASDPRDPAAWARSGSSARRMRVPILMYHLVAAAPAGTAYPGLWVPPAELEDHVAALQRAGFVGVTLGEVWDAWHGDGRLPAHPVVLSFDDGDLSQVLGGAPVLKAVGWPGVLNLAVSHLGKGGIPLWGTRRLIKQGWEIDSHTIDHTDVTTLSGDALTHQLVDSRQQIKARLGVTPRFFCYPAGRNDAASRRAVEQAGYRAATTTEPGLAAATDDPYGLPRLRVDPGLPGRAVVALAKGTRAPSAGAGE